MNIENILKNLSKEKQLFIFKTVTVISLILILILSVIFGCYVSAINKKLTALTEESETQSNQLLMLQSEQSILEANAANTLQLYLPKDIYVTAELTAEIYNDEISFGADSSSLHFVWTCDIGRSMKDKFSICTENNAVGDYPLKLTVYDNAMREVGFAESTLHVIGRYSITEDLMLLTIGDSLTNDPQALARLRKLSGDHIDNVGTKGTDEGLMHEGRAGFAAAHYLTEYVDYYDDTGVHPFYNPETGTFDWDYYKRNTGIDPDAIQLFLGRNGSHVNPTDNAISIMKIVDLIRVDDPDIPIYVVNTIYSGNQDSISNQQNVQGYEAFRENFKLEEDAKMFNLMVRLDELLADKEHVYLVPAAIMHDSTNNFKTEEVPVNPYSETYVHMPLESVHPTSAGYMQIGDAMYSTIAGTWGK